MPAADIPTYEMYTVQSNETITSIAADYQISAELIARYNNLQVTDQLKPGKTLLIPLSGPQPATPAVPAFGAPALTKQPAGVTTANQVVGNIATVTAKSIAIRTKPNGGDILFDKISRGKELLVIDQTATHYAVLMADGSTGWVPRLALSVSNTQMIVDRPTPATIPPVTGRQDIIDTAYQYLGIPYELGGQLPNSVDCSLLVQVVFRKHGINLPRTAAEQFQVGNPVDVQNLVPGDRLYFYSPKHTYKWHTGLYVGGGRFIHASSNRGCVAVSDLSEPTYARIFIGARR